MEFGENNLWLMVYGWDWHYISTLRLYSSIGITPVSALASVSWVDTRRNVLEVSRTFCMIQKKLCRLIA